MTAKGNIWGILRGHIRKGWPPRDGIYSNLFRPESSVLQVQMYVMLCYDARLASKCHWKTRTSKDASCRIYYTTKQKHQYDCKGFYILHLDLQWNNSQMVSQEPSSIQLWRAHEYVRIFVRHAHLSNLSLDLAANSFSCRLLQGETKRTFKAWCSYKATSGTTNNHCNVCYTTGQNLCNINSRKATIGRK